MQRSGSGEADRRRQYAKYGEAVQRRQKHFVGAAQLPPMIRPVASTATIALAWLKSSA